MTDGVPGDPILAMAGTFTVPSLNQGQIETLVCCDYPIPTSVSLTIFSGSSVVAMYTNPADFLYNSGWSAGPAVHYIVDLQTNTNAGSWDFMGVTIVDGLAFADWSGPLEGYEHGYYPVTYTPGEEARVTEVTTAPEPLTLSLFGAGILGLGTARRRTKSA